MHIILTQFDTFAGIQPGEQLRKGINKANKSGKLNSNERELVRSQVSTKIMHLKIKNWTHV